MAIDTAQKRRSAYGMTLPAPDGTIDQPDRQHARWIYTGILADPPQAANIFGQLLALRRPMMRLSMRRPPDA